MGWLVVLGHVLIVLALLGMLAFGNHDSVAGTFGRPLGIDLSPTLELLIWAAVATFLVAIPLAIYLHKAAKARYSLKYLWPHQHNTAMAMAEVLVIGPDEKLTPDQVAADIDDYQVTEVAFKGQGCAISTAATSLLTDELEGMTRQEILTLPTKGASLGEAADWEDEGEQGDPAEAASGI